MCKVNVSATGPPEYPGESQQPVSQAIDIWSLGCVFSLAATWAILGYVGVLEFNEIRKRKIQVLHRSRQAEGLENEDPEGDQFHDGYQLLEIVTGWHQYLRGRLRKCDAISTQVLDLIDNKMLLTNPDERIKADDLCSQLNKIISKSSKEFVDSVPLEIQINLKEIDAAVSNSFESTRRSKALAQGTVNGTTQEPRKSTAIDLMLKTTHRQSILPPNKGRVQLGRQSMGGPLVTQTEASSEPSPHPSQKSMENTHLGRAEAGQSKTTPTRNRASKKSRQHPPQNVFQAREAVMNRDKGNNKIWLKLSKHPQSKKDDVLENYFDQRDIVSLLAGLPEP